MKRRRSSLEGGGEKYKGEEEGGGGMKGEEVEGKDGEKNTVWSVPISNMSPMSNIVCHCAAAERT